MSDATELIQTLKRSALAAVDDAKPVHICFGRVVSAQPLQISVEQKLTLGVQQLVLTRHVTNYTVDVSMRWHTQSALGMHEHSASGLDSAGDTVRLTTDSCDLSHTHALADTMALTVHNGLAAGDDVLLLRMQGGQKYIVADKLA